MLPKVHVVWGNRKRSEPQTRCPSAVPYATSVARPESEVLLIDGDAWLVPDTSCRILSRVAKFGAKIKMKCKIKLCFLHSRAHDNRMRLWRWAGKIPHWVCAMNGNNQERGKGDETQRQWLNPPSNHRPHAYGPSCLKANATSNSDFSLTNWATLVSFHLSFLICKWGIIIVPSLICFMLQWSEV